ncbi:MAG: hypothetical protein FJ388_17190, partial [Verrucomicrobia bacterium]|nr:hypothetical protein [Verrucomicrobiota bacterium]
MKLLSALFLICVATALADDPPNAGFANCDFEQGVAGWGVWYSDDPKAVMTRYPYAADSAVAHGGRQSLKIVAPDENGCAFVTRGSTAMKAGARYEVGYWFRKSPELDERAFHVRFNFRPADKTKADWKMKSVEVLPTRRKTEGKWQYRAGCVRVPKDAGSPVSIGLYLKQARGTIWIDDVQIREVKAGENVIADLWVYDPYRVELGGAPLKKFGALKERNDPILARAARYNETLVKSAFVKEDVRRCLRIRQLWPKANKLDGSVSSATAPHPAPLPANAGRGRDSSSQPAANRMVQRTATGAIESVGQCHAKPVAERASVQPAPSERWRVQLRDRHFQSHPTATATSSP